MVHRLLARVRAFGEPSVPIPLLALTVAAMLATHLKRDVHDVDIFWQLKLGEISLAHGLPRYEPFLAGRENEPLAVVAWLGQAVFALVRQLGGWPLLRLFDAVVWLGGFVVVAWHCRRRHGNDVPVSLGLWVGWFAAVPFASIRPQTFAVIMFGLLVVLARRNFRAKWGVPLGALLLVLWQNLHPSAVVAVAYLGTAAVAEWVNFYVRRGERPTLTRALLVPLAALATLATPAGLDVYRISALNAERSLELGITEWLPLWTQFPEVGRGYAFPMFLATAALVLWRGRRVPVADLVPMLVLMAMTVVAFRFVLFWGIAVIPVWVAALAEPDVPAPPNPWRKRLAVVFLIGSLAPLFLWRNNFHAYFPFDGIAALKRQNVRGAIYSNYFAAGLLTDYGYPDWHPTHDGRYYLISRDELKRYQAAQRGEVPVAELVAKYDPVAFFIRPGDDEGLIALLPAAGWREVYRGEQCVVFVK